jgi:hypothetical protein
MHVSFILLRIKDLYMFRALLAHPQKALHKRHIVYCVRMISAVARSQWNCIRATANWYSQYIQFIENQGPLHVSSITCSTSRGTAQMAFGILRAYNVSWLWHGCSETESVPQPANKTRMQYTKCQVGGTCRRHWTEERFYNIPLATTSLRASLYMIEYLLHHGSKIHGQQSTRMHVTYIERVSSF